MHVEVSEMDGDVRVTVNAEEAQLLEAALCRAAYQDISPDIQAATVAFAEDLLALVKRANLGPPSA